MNFLVLIPFLINLTPISSEIKWPWFVTFNNTKPESFQTILKIEDYGSHWDPTTPPSCIIATMNMTLIHNDGAHHVIPENSIVSGACFRKKQVLRLEWMSENGNKQGLAFVFGFNERSNNITLDSIDGLIDVKGVPLRVYSLKTKLNMFETPFRYCYSCHDPISVKLRSANKDEVTLCFNSVTIEAFRTNPFARSFTHLSWNCKYAWMIAYVPLFIGASLALLVFGMILSFVFRKNMGF